MAAFPLAENGQAPKKFLFRVVIAARAAIPSATSVRLRAPRVTPPS
jgi:hypothetical protein